MNSILEHLKDLPKKWDGKEAISQMKDSGFQWKQMEWPAFYFELICEKSSLKSIAEFKKVRYGNTTFDGFLEVPFDFKTHVINSTTKDIILNDAKAIEKALKEFGNILIVIALGEAVFDDENKTFYKWHEELKGEKSKYVKEAEKRGTTSRRRKAAFNLKKIVVVKLDESALKKSKTFQKGMRNSNGTARREKVMFSLNTLLKECETIEAIEF